MNNINSSPPTLKLTFPLDACTESMNRNEVAYVIERLRLVRRRLSGMSFDSRDGKVAASIAEVEEAILALTRLKGRL